MSIVRGMLLVIALAIASTPAYAEPVLFDFENLTDLETLGAQFDSHGLTVTGATALASGAVGGSLNEFDFPPFSGNTVIFDSDLAGITIDFLRPATVISGYFTYAAAVTLTAYSGATVVGSVTSLFSNNLFASGNPANELLSLTYAGGITRITMIGDPAFGNSFVLDDLFADLQPSVTVVPEPGTVVLLLTGVLGIGRRRWCEVWRREHGC